MGILEAAYYETEQPKSSFDLLKKLKVIKYSEQSNDIIVEFDARKITPQSYGLIQQLSQIITQSGEIGEFELDIFKITIRALNTYEHKLITNNDLYYTSQLRQS